MQNAKCRTTLQFAVCSLQFAMIFLLFSSTCRSPRFGPSPVLLVAPDSDMTVHVGNVAFSWDSTAGAASYELQIDNTFSFLTPVFDTLSVKTSSLEHFLPDGDYYWRVRGLSGDSVWGDWSEAYQVVVADYGIIGQIQTRGYCEALVVRDSYAYVADGEAGLSIYNVSDPSNLRLAGSIMDTLNLAYGVSLAGHYAYLAYGRKQIQVVDITRTDSLQFLGNINVGSSDPSYGYDLKALDTTTVVEANYKYCAVVDVTDPNFPAINGDQTPVGGSRGVAVRGHTAFLACEQDGLVIATFSRESLPEVVGLARTAENARDVTVQGNYAYVADGRYGLTVMDVSDSTNPRIADTLHLPGGGYAEHVTVHDSTAYVGDEIAGIAVVDITNPLSPKLEAMIKTSYARDVFVTPDGRIFATDRDWGLLAIGLVSGDSAKEVK
jgi:hypothetical protein